MSKKLLLEMGLSEELAAKVLENFVPKADFDKVSAENEQGKSAAAKLAEEIDKLNAGKSELEEKLSAAAKEKEEMQLESRIRLAAVKENAYDEDIVVREIDRSKFRIKDDGSVEGLAEGLAALKESKGFLFRAASAGKTEKVGSDGVQTTDGKANVTFGSAIESALAGQFIVNDI